MKKTIFFLGLILIIAANASAASVKILADGQGTHSGWNAVGCSNHWQCVYNFGANYLTSAKNGANDTWTFNISNLQENDTINYINVSVLARRNSTNNSNNVNNSNLRTLTVTNGQTFFSVVRNTTYYGGWLDVMHLSNPATGLPWTIAEVDAIEAGVNVPSNNGGAQVSAAFVVVDYTRPGVSCAKFGTGPWPLNKGWVEGLSSWIAYNYTDACSSSTNVVDWSCNSMTDAPQNRTFNCGLLGKTCSNGACV